MLGCGFVIVSLINSFCFERPVSLYSVSRRFTTHQNKTADRKISQSAVRLSVMVTMDTPLFSLFVVSWIFLNNINRFLFFCFKNPEHNQVSVAVEQLIVGVCLREVWFSFWPWALQHKHMGVKTIIKRGVCVGIQQAAGCCLQGTSFGTADVKPGLQGTN